MRAVGAIPPTSWLECIIGTHAAVVNGPVPGAGKGPGICGFMWPARRPPWPSVAEPLYDRSGVRCTSPPMLAWLERHVSGSSRPVILYLDRPNRVSAAKGRLDGATACFGRSIGKPPTDSKVPKTLHDLYNSVRISGATNCPMNRITPDSRSTRKNRKGRSATKSTAGTLLIIVPTAVAAPASVPFS